MNDITEIWVAAHSYVPDYRRETTTAFIDAFYLTEADCQAQCDIDNKYNVERYNLQVAAWDRIDASNTERVQDALVSHAEQLEKNKILREAGYSVEDARTPTFHPYKRQTYDEWVAKNEVEYNVPERIGIGDHFA